MRVHLLAGLILLGCLGSGCMFHPGYRYPVGYAATRHPGSFWTGVGLASAGNAVLHSAGRQSHPATALATAAVGVGLHVAAAGCLHHAATTPPPRVYRSRYRYSPPCHRRRDYVYYRYGYR